MRRVVPILVALALTVTICFGASRVSAEQQVLVFSAASTRDAMEEAIRAYPGKGIRAVYAASSALARQILDGAPASIFLSASKPWADAVDQTGILASRRNFLRNSLVLVSPLGALLSRPILNAEDILPALDGGRLAIAETRSVPAGIYGREALTSLGVWKGLESRIAQAANVRVALLLVERGETPLGLVYQTGALASKAVSTVWRIPESAHSPIVYPLAFIKSAADNPDATGFHTFLISAKGRRIFARHGFQMD
ncbi:molybdate ABC transporter substrate-binding protein [Alphaproteobacteria bacterium]|jgi:molybdate transport system substrate-binding protein|nr:molybdate ABC transporter substrate-binding protein [Alphaproteobacteria bacterium]